MAVHGRRIRARGVTRATWGVMVQTVSKGGRTRWFSLYIRGWTVGLKVALLTGHSAEKPEEVRQEDTEKERDSVREKKNASIQWMLGLKVLDIRHRQRQSQHNAGKCVRSVSWRSSRGSAHPLRVIYERNARHADRKLETLVGKKETLNVLFTGTV